MAKSTDSRRTRITPESVPRDLVIETKPPVPVPSPDESPEFHAARLLLLLKIAGGRKGKIVGRTKIAKLDFFVRYPSFLAKALEFFPGLSADIEAGPRPESLMIRYKYGPWDSKYYDIFALLVSKGLMDVSPSEGGDVFQLTAKGQFAATELEGPEFDEIAARCHLVAQMFGDTPGSQIKKFIYDHFPEVVSNPRWREIK